MSLFTKIRDTVTNPATAIGTVLGGGVGGALGSTALGNAVTGQPISTGLPQAGGLDLAGLGLGIGLGGIGLGAKGLGMAAGTTGAAAAGPGGLNPGGSYGLGNGGLGGLFGTAGNLLPTAGAAYLGNSQRQDALGQVGKINELGDSLGAQSGAYLRSITNPYDQQTGLGRTALSNSLSQRGVGGSSFGNQQLENFDYMRGLGRGDLTTRAQVGIGGLQGGLYGNALTGINQANQNYNQILGAGLGASGSLFNRGTGGAGGNGLNLPGLGSLGGLGNLFGNGLSGIGSGLGNIFGSPGGSLWGTGGPQQLGIGTDMPVNPEDFTSTGLLDPNMWDPFQGGTLGLS